MRIIGLQDGVGAGAAVVADGTILAAVQEERLGRGKGRGGFPLRAVDEVLRISKVSLEQIDYFVFAGVEGQAIKDSGQLREIYRKMADGKASCREFGESKPDRQERMLPLIKKGVTEDKICFFEEHTCHAAGSYYGWGDMDNEVLVLSCDAAGDSLCATVNIGKGGEIRRIAEISQANSVPYLYGFFTFLMGFVPLEHEYKLMGLAPYSMGSKFSREVADYLWGLFEFSDDNKLGWQRKDGVKDVFLLGEQLADFVKYKRFDALAGGLQLFTEEFFTQWVKRVIAETGIKRLALGGGLFMNVKLNKLIMEMAEVDDVFVFPSCSDETNCIGAAWAKYAEVKQAAGQKVDIPKLGDFYLGGDFDDRQVEKALSEFEFNGSVKWEKYDDIEEKTAQLLSQGNVVARCRGRMEFGARALGNRSILAAADSWDTVREINEMIKRRDFWMPFAPSVLKECADEYIENPKGIEAPYMIMAFETKAEKFGRIIAGTHPYDKSCRAQVVTKEHNADYHRLISCYRQLTGEGAILNTSFNLHGYPIVYRPAEAMAVLDESGLRYLAVGNYLVEKTK